MDVSPEHIEQAMKEERDLFNSSPAVLLVQNQHLNNRVILLRALVNAQKEEIERLETQIKKPARKPTSSN